jgi:hypothetical protein
VRSHELAKLLLARRDNDVMVRVEVDNDPDETNEAELYDDHWVNATGAVYSSDLDRLIITTEQAFGPAYDGDES